MLKRTKIVSLLEADQPIEKYWLKAGSEPAGMQKIFRLLN